jgi:hypothetical protein
VSVAPITEVLFDSDGDGLTAATTETGTVRKAGQFANFQSCEILPGDRVEIDATDLDETDGAAIVWFDGDTSLAAHPTSWPRLFVWTGAADHLIVGYMGKAAGQMITWRKGGTTQAFAIEAGYGFNAGEAQVSYHGWTATQLFAAANGAAFSSIGHTEIPTCGANADIDSQDGSSEHLSGAVAAVAVFNRHLTQDEWDYFAALSRPPLFGELVGRDMLKLWYGENTSYFDTAADILTEDVLNATWSRGQDLALGFVSGSGPAGVFSAELINDDGRYAPQNAAGPLFGKLLPGRALRVRMANATQHYDRWAGKLSAAPEPIYVGRSLYNARLQANGIFSELQAALAVDDAVLTDTLSGAAVTAVLDRIGWPAADRTLDAGIEVFAAWWAGGRTALQELRSIAESDGPGALLIEGADGSVVFEDRHHRLKAPHPTSERTYVDDVGGTLVLRDVQARDPTEDIYNRVVIQTRSYADTGLATDVLWTHPDPVPTIPAGDTLTVRAVWPPASVPDGAYVSAWVTPDATDIIPDSPVVFADLGIVVTKRARVMELAITNNHGSADARLGTLRARGQGRLFLDPVEISAEDTTSQGAYGLRVFPLPGEWLSDSIAAVDFADEVIARKKDPKLTAVLAPLPRRTEAMLTGVLETDISDRLTLDADIPQFGINATDVFVEHITEEVARNGADYYVEWIVREATTASGWILGTSLLGTGTTLVY